MSLDQICNWGYPEKAAIEYQDPVNTRYISYDELNTSKKIVSDSLSGITGVEFVGISCDIKNYLIPSLILGITISGYGFVNIPLDATASKHLLALLSIKYQFTSHVSSKTKVITCFKIHGDYVYLIKSGTVEDKAPEMRTYFYAYGISTSGSTGIPKVVRVPYSCIIPNILDLVEILHITESDKIMQFTNVTFDPSIIEIFLALSTGATLYMVSHSLKSDVYRLLTEIYQKQVTVLQATPSVFLYSWSSKCLKDTVLSAKSFLRILLLGGECFPNVDEIFSCKHVNNTTRLFNIYGITEVSCWASINEITDSSSDFRYLGKPLAKTIFEVRDEQGLEIKNGKGLLYIGSNDRICVIENERSTDLIPPVFRDTGDIVYIDNEKRIYYKGRSTNVIKRFGNKVDLTILEKAASELTFVENAWALWDENSHLLHLCLLVLKDTQEDIEDDARSYLNKLEPIYRPNKIHVIKHVEFTTSGKICLKYLKQQCFQDEESNGPQNDAKQVLTKTWKQYLTLDEKGFLELGGTSIIALQISQSLSKDFSNQFPELIGMLLKNSTIEDCLSYINLCLLSPIDNASKETQKPEKQSYSRDGEVANTSENKTLGRSTMIKDLRISKNGKDTYQWHKCRGQIYQNRNVDFFNPSNDRIHSSVQVLYTFNLKKCIDASPSVFQYLGGKLCASVGSHSGMICSVELEETSARSYEVTLPDRIESSVLILDDFRGIVGCYDGYVYCLCLKTGEIFWRFQTSNVVKCTAVASKKGGEIFVGSYDCHAYCLSVENGSEIWRVKASTGSISASGCLYDEKDCVLFGTLDGSCLALQQSSGAIIWKRKLSNPIFVAPIVLHSGLVLFCTVAGTVTCFDIDKSTEVWNYVINGNIFAYMITRYDPNTKRESIILASQNKSVYILEVNNDVEYCQPTLKDLINFEAPIFATPWYNADDIFLASTDGTLSVYKKHEKKIEKLIRLPGEIFSSPVVHDDYMFVGCRDDNFYVLRLIDGK